MVTEYEQGGLNLGCDDALPEESPLTKGSARDTLPSNDPRLYPMEIEEPSSGAARESRVSDDLGILDTSNGGWHCGGGCCDLVDGGENGPRKTSATQLARSLSALRHGNRRAVLVGGLVAIAVVMVIVAIAIYCSAGRTESEVPVTGINCTVLGRGRLVPNVLPSHNQTSTKCDQQTLHSFLVRSLQYELQRLVEKTRFREQCTGFHVAGINLEDGVFEYKVVCYGIVDDHFTHDLRSDMVDLLGATQAADLRIFVLDPASLQLQPPVPDEIHKPEVPYIPVVIPVCLTVPYNRTCYPNILHHQSHLEALTAGLESIFLLEEPCSDHLHLLWCSLFVPDCTNETPLPPCRSLCQAVLIDCPQLRPAFEHLLERGCSGLPDDAGTSCTGIPEETGSLRKCHAVPVSECRALGFTSTPGSGNLLGQSPGASLYWWHQLEIVGSRTQCSPHLMTFACSVFYPQCTEAEVTDDRPEVVGPCESLCWAVKRDCDFFFSLAGMRFLADYNCSNHLSPSNQHTCPATSTDFNSTDLECTEMQFRCDSRQCISSRWICDGRTDCGNGKDEEDCAECPSERFRCNNGQCLPLTRRCNGQVDCLQGDDEIDCLRVSTEDEEGVGGGLVEIHNPYTKDWGPICIEEPQEEDLAEEICNLNRLSVLANNNRRINDSKVGLLGYLSSRTNCSQHQRSFIRCNYSDCTHGPLPGQLSRHFGSSTFGDILGDGDWPWVVSLHGGQRRSFYCGGVLVTDQWILTAAHCIGSQSPDVSDLTVMAGHSRRTAKDPSRQLRSALRLVVHPDFSSYLLNDDIALILVDRPFRLGPRVRSLCLPDATYRPTEGQTCYVGGWGKTSDTDRDYMEELWLRQLNVESVVWCDRVLVSAEHSLDGRRIICTTGRHGSDIHQGDSGSAVLCESSPTGEGVWPRLILAGVVSSGFESDHYNSTKILSVQTAIAPYTDWIRQQISATSSQAATTSPFHS